VVVGLLYRILLNLLSGHKLQARLQASENTETPFVAPGGGGVEPRFGRLRSLTRSLAQK